MKLSCKALQVWQPFTGKELPLQSKWSCPAFMKAAECANCAG